MKKKIYVVQDTKAEYFMNPMVHRNNGEALRAFEEGATHPESFISKYPSNFNLILVGEFCEETGRINSVDHTPLANGMDFAKIEE